MSDEMGDPKRGVHQGDVPSDRERLVGDTAASAPLTSASPVQPGEIRSRESHEQQEASPRRASASNEEDADADEQLGHS